MALDAGLAVRGVARLSRASLKRASVDTSSSTTSAVKKPRSSEDPITDNILMVTSLSLKRRRMRTMSHLLAVFVVWLWFSVLAWSLLLRRLYLQTLVLCLLLCLRLSQLLVAWSLLSPSRRRLLPLVISRVPLLVLRRVVA